MTPVLRLSTLQKVTGGGTEMIRAPVDLAADFKRCCTLSGEFDGSDRDHYSR
jgi:hypothetical protein